VPPGARLVSVAKRRDRHTMQQAAIGDLLVAEALAGNIVVRLKGGDPFIFGRGGEEVSACHAAGVAVEVIPGISSAMGGAAAALMPLTHRDHASIVSFVAGECRGLAEQNWVGLAGKGRTLVIYMGVTGADRIAEKLDRLLNRIDGRMGPGGPHHGPDHARHHGRPPHDGPDRDRPHHDRPHHDRAEWGGPQRELPPEAREMLEKRMQEGRERMQQAREEMEVFFTFLAECYERRSVMISSNLVFSQWDQIFKDPMTTMAAIDRLVHHSTILEFAGDSHRARRAKDKDATDTTGKS
jgi:hypothetical protein